eukprot:9490415-Pyramimonas_sp.AAC.1
MASSWPPPKAPLAGFACGSPPISAHPSHVSWPHKGGTPNASDMARMRFPDTFGTHLTHFVAL